MLRTFLALPIPNTVADNLLGVADTLRRQLPPKSIRWVPRENLHLTLWFLGATRADQVSELSAALDALSDERGSFELRLHTIGCFPTERRPRVFWVGLQDDHALQQLHRDLGDQLAPLGWEPEARAFHPHVTLGYARKNHLPSWDGNVAVPATTWRADQVTLFESHLTPDGPTYKPLHTTALD